MSSGAPGFAGCEQKPRETFAQIQKQFEGKKVIPVGAAANRAALAEKEAGAKRNPEDFATQYNLAVTALQARKWEIALAAAAKAHSLKPDSNVAREIYAYCLQQQGKLDEAAKIWELIVTSEKPFKSMIRNNLCNYYKIRKQFQKAEMECLQALEDKDLFSPEIVHLNLGDVYLQQGRFPKAIQAIQEGLKISPNLRYAHHQLGRIALLQEDYSGAMEEFEKETANPRASWESHYYLAVAASRVVPPQLDRARKAMEKVDELRPGESAYHRAVLAELYLDAGKSEEAGKLAKEAVEGMPIFRKDQRNLAYYVLARSLSELGETEKAKDSYQKFRETESAVDGTDPQQRRRMNALERLFGSH